MLLTLLLSLEVLVSELLAGESKFSDVLQTICGCFLHIFILRSNQFEQVGDNLEIFKFRILSPKNILVR